MRTTSLSVRKLLTRPSLAKLIISASRSLWSSTNFWSSDGKDPRGCPGVTFQTKTHSYEISLLHESSLGHDPGANFKPCVDVNEDIATVELVQHPIEQSCRRILICRHNGSNITSDRSSTGQSISAYVTIRRANRERWN